MYVGSLAARYAKDKPLYYILVSRQLFVVEQINKLGCAAVVHEYKLPYYTVSRINVAFLCV